MIQDPRKMVLPFEPMTLTFENVQYFVDTPQGMRKQGFKDKRLQLLHDMTGSFRPRILTALMGVTGAGKTTLMDVLSGRKDGGYIEGDIRIGGFPKVQQTFAMISGYCEQTDIHSPQITVEESIVFSAWLRLPSQIDTNTRALSWLLHISCHSYEFVRDVLERVELDGIGNYLVGIPGVSGLSNEQRKCLTIAVELGGTGKQMEELKMCRRRRVPPDGSPQVSEKCSDADLLSPLVSPGSWCLGAVIKKLQ